MGFAHTVECWKDGEMVGGLYGISIGGAFFGESMFSRATDASKVALVHLAVRLKLGGYQLLDTQFVTPHLQQFGTVEIPPGRIPAAADPRHRQAGQISGRRISMAEVEAFLQSTTQTS